MCDTHLYFSSTMQGADKSKLHDLQQFYVDAQQDESAFPAVSIIAPYDSISGHPGYAMETGFDELLRGVVDKVKQNPALWKKTAIFVTFDESGGYYDSGYVQFIDFFGDGPRIPLLVISPHAKKGYVDHTYYDHASILKFIERNWEHAAAVVAQPRQLAQPDTRQGLALCAEKSPGDWRSDEPDKGVKMKKLKLSLLLMSLLIPVVAHAESPVASVEFTSTPAPETDAERTSLYTRSSAIVTYRNGTKKSSR